MTGQFKKIFLLVLCLLVLAGCGQTTGGGAGSGSIDLRFVVLGDSQGINSTFPINTIILSNLINKILALNPQPSFILFLGDLVYAGGTSELNAWNQAVSQLTGNGISIYPTIGNHDMNDGYGEKQAAWQNNFYLPVNGPAGYDELAYYFESGPALFACLDSFYYDGVDFFSYQIKTAQRDWLSSLLSSSSKKFKFVFTHVPAYSSSGHDGTCLDTYPDKRDAFWKILDDNAVDLYFCGHEHLYSRWAIGAAVNPSWHNNVVQIDSGGAGGILTPVVDNRADALTSTFHFVVVDLTGNSLNLTAYDYQGNVIDTYSKTK